MALRRQEMNRTPMISRHVLGIGLPVNLPGIVPGLFLSRQNFSEFDLIIWDPASVSKELEKMGAHAGNEPRIKKLITERSWELINYTQTGRDVIVILRPLPDQLISLLLFQHALGIGTKNRHGNRVEWTGPQSFPVQQPALIADLSYSAVCEPTENGFRPLYRVVGASDIVGGFLNLTKFGSLVIFVPHVQHWDHVAMKSAYQDQATAYISALIELPVLIRALLAERTDQPSWASGFVLPKEQEAMSEIDKLETRIGELREQVQSRQQVVSAEREWKYLFTAYDQPLVSVVIRALG